MIEYKDNIIYNFNLTEKNSEQDFEYILGKMLKKKLNYHQRIVILCIGSDYSVGDCLGPLIGHMLICSHYGNLTIYGTLKEPVHSTNLKETMEIINNRYYNPLVIAIDSSLDSDSSNIGNVTLRAESISPGIAFGKILPNVGHISILGVVNVSGISFDEFLQTTRMNLIMQIANFITNGLLNVFDSIDLIN